MDKEWVFLDRRSDEYMDGLRAFINNALEVCSFEGKIKCPCVECYNCGWKTPEEVQEHLKVDGMWPDYVNSRWKWHGEPLPMPNVGEPLLGDADIGAMLRDAFGMHGPNNDDNVEEEDAPPPNLNPDAENFYRLIEEGRSELYPGCGKSKLDFILQVYQHKTTNSWTDESFTGLLDLLKVFFPQADQEVRNQVFNTVLGPEKRNRVRGYGCGAKWVDVPGIVTQKNGLKNQIRDLTLAYEAQRAANENRGADMAQKLQESAEREEALKNSLGVVNKKLEQLEAQVGANPLTQIFAAAGMNMDSLDLSRLITFLKKPDNPEASCHLNGQTAQHIGQGCPPC